MKLGLLHLILLPVFVLSCNEPSTTRSTGGGIGQTNPAYDSPFSNYNSDSHYYLKDAGQSENDPYLDPGQSQVPVEISHCTWSRNGADGYAFSSGHFSRGEIDSVEKNINLCQHRGEELKVYLQLKHPLSEGVCLVPTFHNEQDGKQVSIGNFRCQRMTSDNTKAQLFELVKDRVGMTKFPVTGVMLMKDKKYVYPSPYPRHPISSLSAYGHCIKELAQNRNPSFCIAFKNAGHYFYHQFPKSQ